MEKEFAVKMTDGAGEPAPETRRPRVSVIIPVYNVEPWLRRCLDSVTSQTLEDIEIILIDDGSTDGSGQICGEYAARDPRIRIHRQENRGLSAARNAGIGLARADYLMFVDSDDWVEPDFCRIPYAAAAEHQADLVMFRHRFLRGRRRTKRLPPLPEGFRTQEEAMALLISGIGMAAWNKLYHRSLFRTLRYPEGHVYEDLVLSPLLVREAGRIWCSSAILYNRTYRKGSITAVSSERYTRDLYDAVETTVRNLRSWGYDGDAEYLLQRSRLSIAVRSWDCPELHARSMEYLKGLGCCPPRFTRRRKLLFHLLLRSPGLCRRVHALYRRFL